MRNLLEPLIPGTVIPHHKGFFLDAEPVLCKAMGPCRLGLATVRAAQLCTLPTCTGGSEGFLHRGAACSSPAPLFWTQNQKSCVRGVLGPNSGLCGQWTEEWKLRSSDLNTAERSAGPGGRWGARSWGQGAVGRETPFRVREGSLGPGVPGQVRRGAFKLPCPAAP